jgi:hypothetical protein
MADSSDRIAEEMLVGKPKLCKYIISNSCHMLKQPSQQLCHILGDWHHAMMIKAASPARLVKFLTAIIIKSVSNPLMV